MNKKNDILKMIINDLKIRQYDGECRSQYISRVIYSALSIWVRVSTLDEDIFEQSLDHIGVSKIHILNRCKPFLDNMMKIYPEVYEWFYPKDCEENAIVIIRDRLYRGGELVDVGFNTDLALPNYREYIVNKGVVVIRGVNGKSFQNAIGLAQFKVIDEKNDIDSEKAFEFYGLKNQSAQEVLKEHIKDIKWNEKQEISAQIFNKYCRNSFSNCWDYEYKLKNNDITLYRNDFFDFGFIKKSNDKVYISQIKKYLIDHYEIRRYMYGLKNDVENSVVAKYKMYDEKELVELNLYNSLPQKEQNILLLLGWPIKNINDQYNLLFHKFIWKFIKIVLKNLNINLQEVK